MLWIDKKYIALVGQRLERFKQKSDTTWTFRCPICGDSQKNRSKTRGFLFIRDGVTFFKCHNCSRSLNLYQFLDHTDSTLCRAYAMEVFANRTPEERDAPKQEPKILGKKVSLLEDVGAISARKSDRAMQYLRHRRIPDERIDDLYYMRDYSRLVELNSDYRGRLVKEERIVIPLLSKKGSLMGVSGRALEDSGKRYVQCRLQEGVLMYGYQHIDEKKPIYACEGAFDSMFVPNCIAVMNSGLDRMRDKIVIFDNEPRNKQIVQLMYKAAERGTVVIWPREWKYKDINQAIMNGVSVKDIYDIIYSNTFTGLELQMRLNAWQR